MPALLLAGTVLSAVPAGSAPVRASRHAARHEFHVSYTRMAVEGSTISAQIRVFPDDMQKALAARARNAGLQLASKPAEAAFQAYLGDRFPVTANGRRLVATVASSAADGQMWAYIVTWTAAAPVTSLSMHNAVLFEQFEDQQNIVKVRHLASGQESTQFYGGGSQADQVLRF